MAVRFTVQAPRNAVDKQVLHACQECDDLDITQPKTHAKLKHSNLGRHVIIDDPHGFSKWYGVTQ